MNRASHCDRANKLSSLSPPLAAAAAKPLLSNPTFGLLHHIHHPVRSGIPGCTVSVNLSTAQEWYKVSTAICNGMKCDYFHTDFKRSNARGSLRVPTVRIVRVKCDLSPQINSDTVERWPIILFDGGFRDWFVAIAVSLGREAVARTWHTFATREPLRGVCWSAKEGVPIRGKVVQLSIVVDCGSRVEEV